MKQSKLVSEQFGAAAQGYLTSDVHANGADLQRLMELVGRQQCRNALDLGCGAGHAAFAIAKAGTAVTAYDLAPEMLAVVENAAMQRGLTDIKTQQGAAEQLPFADDYFDLVVTRYSAHHWSNVPTALGEVRRVLKPAGSLVVIDTVAAENPLFDTVLQSLEILADPSHVRDYRHSEWQAMLQDAGFELEANDSWRLAVAFPDWIARKRTSAFRADAIREVIAQAADEVRQYLYEDGAINLDVAWLQAS
jgi:ubiquinone/menaquinone biosynthesis C-methylase UbiE